MSDQPVPQSSTFGSFPTSTRFGTTPQLVETPQLDVVPLTASEKPLEQVDPSALAVDLPSGFHFYEFKTLSLRPIKGYHQSKFARAASEKSNRHTLDAVSSLLPNGISAYDLTLQDFYWVLYYLRITCYSKQNFVHKSVCNNPEHLRSVALGEDKPESLVTVTNISKTTLKDTALDVRKLAAFDSSITETGTFQQYNVKESPVFAGDLLETELAINAHEEYLESTEKDTSYPHADIDMPEFEYLLELACSIRSKNPSEKISLSKRISIIKEMSPDETAHLKSYDELANGYGIEETITVTCGKCGAENKTTVSISAHTFL